MEETEIKYSLAYNEPTLATHFAWKFIYFVGGLGLGTAVYHALVNPEGTREVAEDVIKLITGQ